MEKHLEEDFLLEINEHIIRLHLYQGVNDDSDIKYFFPIHKNNLFEKFTLITILNFVSILKVLTL
jgi:hypothetical protein